MRLLKIIILAGTLMLMACDKSIDEKPVSFDVISTKKNGQETATFKTTDTIVYKLSGLPDVITFYSGAVGQRYEFKDRITANGIPQLQFTSVRANGTQANSIQLLISSDFKGVVAKSQTITGVITRDTAATNANIAAANWTDITSRAAWSTGATTATPSGVVNLSDFAAQGKPVFIAFKYKATAGSIQNKWTIGALSLNNLLEDNTVYTQANFAASNQLITNYGVNTPGLGWLSIYDENLNANKYGWVYTTGVGAAGSLVITGAATVPAATAPAESWAILGPVDLRKVTPDAGLAIKEITALVKTYTSTTVYTAGNYKATFVASNNTVDGKSVAVKQLPITITNP
jgi:hypothetical protein